MNAGEKGAVISRHTCSLERLNADCFPSGNGFLVFLQNGNTMIKAKELKEPLYELRIGGRGKYCALFADVYDPNGNSEIVSGKYLVTEFWCLGSLKTIRRDERGYFEEDDLEKLIVEVEKEWSGCDTQGKPFFVNGFIFTRMTGRSKTETYPLKEADGSIKVVDGKQVNTWITWHESPIEFYQVEIDKKKRIK